MTPNQASEQSTQKTQQNEKRGVSGHTPATKKATLEEIYTKTICDLGEGMTCHKNGLTGVCENGGCNTSNTHWLNIEDWMGSSTFLKKVRAEWKTKYKTPLTAKRVKQVFNWGDVDNNKLLDDEEGKYVLSPLQWRPVITQITWEWSDNEGLPNYKPIALRQNQLMSFEVFTRMASIYLRSFGVQPRKDVLTRIFNENKSPKNDGLTKEEFQKIQAPKHWSFSFESYPPELTYDDIENEATFKKWAIKRSSYYGRGNNGYKKGEQIPTTAVLKRVYGCIKEFDDPATFDENAEQPFQWEDNNDDWEEATSATDYWESKFDEDVPYNLNIFKIKVADYLEYCGWKPDSISDKTIKDKFGEGNQFGKTLKKLPIPIEW